MSSLTQEDLQEIGDALSRVNTQVITSLLLLGAVVILILFI